MKLITDFAPPPKCKGLFAMLSQAYLQHKGTRSGGGMGTHIVNNSCIVAMLTVEFRALKFNTRAVEMYGAP